MTALVIGERGSVRAFPAESQSGRRLERAFGGRSFDAMNVVDRQSLRWMITRGYPVRGLAYPVGGAAAYAATLTLRHDIVLLAGRRAAAAFGVDPRWPFYEWTYLLREPCPISDRCPLVVLHEDIVRAAVIPHPSGRNRWWNDSDAVDELNRFVKKETLCHSYRAQ